MKIEIQVNEKAVIIVKQFDEIKIQAIILIYSL